MKKIKRISVLLIAAFCMLFAGCSNRFAKEEYADTSIIAENDRYAETGWKKESFYNGFHVTAKKFDGRETLLTNTNPDDAFEITATTALRLSDGTAKLVLIDGGGNVSTVAECSADESPQIIETQVTIPNGNCVFKLVGHGCKNVEMQMTLDYDTAGVKQ